MARQRHFDAHALTRRNILTLAGGAAAGGLLPFDYANVAMAQGVKTLRVRMGSDISVLDPSHIFQIENRPSLATSSMVS